MPPLVRMEQISKRFGNVAALSDVSISLRGGRVHGLLGENGAGKSTLMNVLYGLIQPERGSISIDDKTVSIRSPLDAVRHGIGMVHQHFMLAGAMTVLDNVLIGDRRFGAILRRREAAERLVALAESMALQIDPAARCEDLSVGQQQRVEILKALWRDVRLLILDEPTTVLTPSEAEQLFVAVNRLKASGRSIVFISHRLGEIRQVCDDLTVLRRGTVVYDGDAQSLSNAELSQIMVGREIAPLRLQRDDPSSRPLVLEATGLTAGKLRDVSLQIHGGEILGIAGVDGNGQQELAEVLVGLRSAASGTVRLAGQDITHRSASERFAMGMAHIPNDRKAEGLVGTMSVAENLVLKQYNAAPFSRGGFLSLRQMRTTAQQMVERFDIRTYGVDASVATLSGGNAQKVILARELGLREPRAVVAINPSRGLDLAATEFVHQQLLNIRKQGGAVLLISSELDELFALSDRIAVLFAGRLTLSDFPVGGIKSIGQLMTGAVQSGSPA
jgi:ABC-type uncharacterized transport system ATPase subunit